MIRGRGRRTHARDSRGRKVPNLYRYDYVDAGGRARTTWSVSYKRNGRQRMVKLDAQSVGTEPADLTEAKKARDSFLVGLDEGRIVQRDNATFGTVFEEYQDSRSLSHRTREHERHLLEGHLGDVKDRRVQDVTSTEVARVLKAMRDHRPSPYSAWTQTAVYRLLRGTFALAELRGIVTRNPCDGLAPSERPKQRNAKGVRRLNDAEIARLVGGTASERWKAAIGLAGYAGLRLGEIRGLRWRDVDLDANEVNVRRSLLADGTPNATKTRAGERTVPMLPALRRLLIAWRLRSPKTGYDDLVIGTADGYPIAERNLRRSLVAAVTEAGIVVADDERLSWHSLRHSAGSFLATELEVPATTLARVMGHTDPGFTYRVYARDARKQADVTADVLARAEAAGVGV